MLAGIAALAALAALVLLSGVGRDADSAVPSVERGSQPAPAPVVAPAPAPAGASMDPRVAASPEESISPTRSEAVDHPLRDRTAAVIVHAILEPSGDPAAGLVVTLTGLRSEDLRSATTDGAGRVEFQGLRAGEKAVSGAFAGQTEFTLGTGERRTVELVVPEGVTVRVRVTTDAHVPVPGAAVLLSSQSNALFGSVVATTDGEGECELFGVEPWRNLWVEAEGYETSYSVPIERGGHVAVVLSHEGATLSGRVVRADSGEGVPGARVWIVGYVFGGSVTQSDGSVRIDQPPPPHTSTTDARGDFRAPVSDRAKLTLLTVAAGYATRQVPLTPEMLASRHRVVELEPSPGLFGFVRDEHGEPVGSAGIKLSAASLTMPLETQSEKDGSFCVPGAPVGDVLLQAHAAGGYSGELRATVHAGEENDVVVPVSTADSVLVRVLTSTGEPLAGCALVRVLEPAGPTQFLTLRHLGWTNAEGACRFQSARLDPGATLGVVLPDVKPSFPFATARWSDGESELEIVVPDGPNPATLRFDCGRDQEDGVASTAILFVRTSDAGPWLDRSMKEGESCSYEGLAPGVYRAHVAWQGAEYDLGLFDVAPGEVRVVPFDPRDCAALPRASLAEQR